MCEHWLSLLRASTRHPGEAFTLRNLSESRTLRLQSGCFPVLSIFRNENTSFFFLPRVNCSGLPAVPSPCAVSATIIVRDKSVCPPQQSVAKPSKPDGWQSADSNLPGMCCVPTFLCSPKPNRKPCFPALCLSAHIFRTPVQLFRNFCRHQQDF